MQFTTLVVLTGLGLSALCQASSPAAAQAPSLGTAQRFAVLGGSTVTNTGASSLTGDLGVSPGTSITGFPPGIVTGTIHAGDAVALQAQNDLTTAYNALTGAACTANMTGQDLGGLTLTPGVYCFSSSAPLNGVLTLDAQGDPNAVFIFQIGSTLLAAIDSSVNVINGARPANVFWQVGSSATLAAGTAFTGNVVALASITLSVGSSVSGRALARTGAVTMDTTSVSVPLENGCLGLASAIQYLPACTLPTAPLLTTTLPVMGQVAMIHLSGSAASVPGVLRVTLFRGPFALTDDCQRFLTTPSSFVFARFVTDINGAVDVRRLVPDDPFFCGTRWVVQAVTFAPAGPMRAAASNMLLVTLGS